MAMHAPRIKYALVNVRHESRRVNQGVSRQLRAQDLRHPNRKSELPAEEKEKRKTHSLIPPLSIRDVTKDIPMRDHHNLLRLGAQPGGFIVVMVVTAQPLTNPARAFFNSEGIEDPLFRVPRLGAGPMRRRVSR